MAMICCPNSNSAYVYILHLSETLFNLLSEFLNMDWFLPLCSMWAVWPFRIQFIKHMKRECQRRVQHKVTLLSWGGSWSNRMWELPDQDIFFFIFFFFFPGGCCLCLGKSDRNRGSKRWLSVSEQPFPGIWSSPCSRNLFLFLFYTLLSPLSACYEVTHSKT